MLSTSHNAYPPIGAFLACCRFPNATAADLATKLYQAPTCKNSKRFSKPKTSMTAFTIDHYAGAVTYEVRTL